MASSSLSTSDSDTTTTSTWATSSSSSTLHHSSAPLRDYVVVITGATRGIGRGLAIGFGEQGAHVVITGRTVKGDRSLHATRAAIHAVGGTCHTFAVDHSDDASVLAFFDDLASYLRSRRKTLALSSPSTCPDAHHLVFINNAFDAVQLLVENNGLPYWARTPHDPADYWDRVNGVGLRNHYVCCVHASRLIQQFCGPLPPAHASTTSAPTAEPVDRVQSVLVEEGTDLVHGGDSMGTERGRGMIINITSWGGIIPLFDIAYSIGKAGIDRMSAEFARNCPTYMRVFSFCPGFVGTEALLSAATKQQRHAQHVDVVCETEPHGSGGGTADGEDSSDRGAATTTKADDLAKLPLWNVETPLFVGRVLAAIVSDDKFADSMHGKVVIAAEAADHLNVDDENGFRALSSRSVRAMAIKAVPQLGDSPLRFMIPRTLLIPWWVLRAKSAAVQYWN